MRTAFLVALIYNNFDLGMNTSEQIQQTQVISEHSLMTSFLQFNQTHTKFLTIGEQGQVNLYTASPPTRVCYTSAYPSPNERFNQVPTCMQWGNHLSGGAVAIGGSLGKLVIFRVVGESIVREKEFVLGGDSAVFSLDWNGVKPELFVGTNDGGVCFVDEADYGWRIGKVFKVGDGGVLVACGIQGTEDYFVAVKNVLYRFDKSIAVQGKQKPLNKLIQLSTDQKISSLIIRTQCMTDHTEIYILTKDKLRCYIDKSKQDSNSSNTKVILSQQEDLKEKGYNYLSWGWNQSQLVVYSTTLPEKEKNSSAGQAFKERLPIVFVRKLNGKLVLKK